MICGFHVAFKQQSKNIMKQSKLFLFTAYLAAIFLCSCGKGKLSESDAAKQLQEYFAKKPDDKSETVRLPISNENNKSFGYIWKDLCYFKGQYACPNNPVEPVSKCSSEDCPEGSPLKNAEHLVNLKNKGLVNTELLGSVLPKSDYQTGALYFKVHITEEGKKYFVKDEIGYEGHTWAIMKTRIFGEAVIKAIGVPSDIGGERVSVVKYTLKYNLTPFGEEFSARGFLSEIEGEALFVLYEKGWLLEKASMNKLW